MNRFAPRYDHLANDFFSIPLGKGSLQKARVLFDEMPHRNVVTWTAMITGNNSCNHYKSAWNVFPQMLRDGAQPNDFTISAVLKACKGLKALLCGQLAHALAIKVGVQGSSIYVDNALMDMYATCCATMNHAKMVFEDITTKTDVCWTTFITGYTHRGDAYGGLRVFCQMFLEEGALSPFSFSIAARACASIGWCFLGKQVHAAVVKHGFESNLPVKNSILDMYCKCHSVSGAKQLFSEMSHKDTITWNTLIAGFEALDSRVSLCIFSQMVSEGFSPDCFSFTSVLGACANLAVLYCGQQLHGVIVHKGLDNNLEISNALIYMYAKGGNIAYSHKIFSKMPCTNLVSWTSMMIGYGDHGYGKEAVELFDEMVGLGIKPDRMMFMAILSACSHAGLVEEGLRYFRLMTNCYHIAPDIVIYGCVVDLLGRVGKVKEAYQLIESMPFEPDESIWATLLGACKLHKQSRVAKLAALRALDMKPIKAGTYALLSNIYAAEGDWDDFASLKKLRRSIKNKSDSGRSWIELKDQVCSFVVGDRFVSSNKEVCEVLKLLILHIKDVDMDNVHDLEDKNDHLNGS